MCSISSGPVHTLPGHTKKLSDRHNVCEHCQTEPATIQLQGETDSFGCEYIYVCDKCYPYYAKTSFSGVCDHCGVVHDHVGPCRDPEEGMCGPVYDLCPDCKVRMLSVEE